MPKCRGRVMHAWLDECGHEVIESRRKAICQLPKRQHSRKQKCCAGRISAGVRLTEAQLWTQLIKNMQEERLKKGTKWHDVQGHSSRSHTLKWETTGLDPADNSSGEAAKWKRESFISLKLKADQLLSLLLHLSLCKFSISNKLLENAALFTSCPTVREKDELAKDKSCEKGAQVPLWREKKQICNKARKLICRWERKNNVSLGSSSLIRTLTYQHAAALRCHAAVSMSHSTSTRRGSAAQSEKRWNAAATSSTHWYMDVA